MQQPLGESAFWVLTTLAAGRRHGYGIVHDVTATSQGAVRLKATTLYAVLERLERDRLVEQDGDEIVEGRTRRYFRITDAGARRLQSETTRLTSKVAVAHASLSRYQPAARLS